MRHRPLQEPLDEAERQYRIMKVNWEYEQEIRQRRSDPPYYG